MKAPLNTRKMPDIEQTLRCIIISADDELCLLFKQHSLSSADIKRMSELTSLLLLVRKSAKTLVEPEPKTTNGPKEKLEDIL